LRKVLFKKVKSGVQVARYLQSGLLFSLIRNIFWDCFWEDRGISTGGR